MRVLMMTTPVSTHLTPLVPLAWAFRAAGHEVLVAGRSDVQAAARSAGLNAVEIGGPLDLDGMLAQRIGGVRPLEAWGRPPFDQLSNFGRLWMAQTLEVLPDYLAFARVFRPDLIVSEPLEYMSLIAGAELGVPVVQQRWGVDPLSGPALANGRTWFKDAYTGLGLSDLPRPAVILDPCPPSLQLPGIEPGVPMRYVPFNGNGRLPPWLREEWRRRQERADHGPIRRVAVSLGGRTLAYNGVPLMRGILSAFAELPDTEAVVTVEEEYREAIGPVPAQVRLIDPVPLHLLLDSCAAVVHHGGSGTAMTATSFGLPQFVLPQLADQFWHGDRLVEAGAAICLDDADRQNDAGELSAALATLLADPGYAKAAGELRREMAAMPTPADVVADLEHLV
ncbi:nucleotide disphospho-sugar-binding domain-containing protein [Streptomyces avermitilis]|uniref:nucleotide disphospho-sugar-binding domain-containing protein n=1 Tax=Streptomyces avermitilis TaxID=33903 RepID=UPI0033CC5C77